MTEELVSLVVVNIPNFAGFMIGLLVLWGISRKHLTIINEQQKMIVDLALRCSEKDNESS